MSIRVKIARWLAPEWAEMERDHKWATSINGTYMQAMADTEDRHTKALQDIASRATPKASHTVKKMAKIAQDALK